MAGAGATNPGKSGVKAGYGGVGAVEGKETATAAVPDASDPRGKRDSYLGG
jgi:hypothetical protein